MSILDKAIALAVAVHAGQLDKGGRPYILHPLRLMLRFEREPEMIVAVLHDVVEDGEIDEAYLRDQGFSKEVLQAIESLSRGDAEGYSQYIERVARNSIAAKVKLADLQDNLNLARIDEIGEKDIERVKKYQKALKQLRRLSRPVPSTASTRKSSEKRPKMDGE